MSSKISDADFYDWVADMTGDMAKLSRPRSTELAAILEVASSLATRLKQPAPTTTLQTDVRPSRPKVRAAG